MVSFRLSRVLGLLLVILHIEFDRLSLKLSIVSFLFVIGLTAWIDTLVQLIFMDRYIYLVFFEEFPRSSACANRLIEKFGAAIR